MQVEGTPASSCGATEGVQSICVLGDGNEWSVSSYMVEGR